MKRLNYKSKFISVIALAIAIYLVIKYVPETPFQRITETFDEVSNQTISGRVDIWLSGLSIWTADGFTSFFGLGIGGYFVEVGRAAHSTPISVLVQTGIFGFLLFYASVLSLTRQAIKTDRTATWICITILATWFIGVTALSWEYRKPTWVLWSLVGSLAYSHTLRPNRIRGSWKHKSP